MNACIAGVTHPLGKDMLPWMNHMPTSNLTALARIEKSEDGGKSSNASKTNASAACLVLA